MSSDFRIATKAKELAIYTFKTTSNCNKYPKKYRFSLVDKLQNKSILLHDAILEGNRYDATQSTLERRGKQSEAINYCDEILFYIELSMELGIIDAACVEYWAKMASDIKHMVLAWKKKDKSV